MKRITAVLAAIAVCAVCSTVHALYSIADEGQWPATWPKELEPLRKQARTLEGPEAPQLHYEIPFAKREAFEAAWPHVLAVKTKGAPVVLRRGPDTGMGDTMNAGVIVHCPPAGTDRRVHPEGPIAGVAEVRMRWMNTNYVELYVDGQIVDLNRIALPAETPIIDLRFEDAEKK